MRCAYCGVEVTEYPANGICVCCGGKLPERPTGIRCPSCGSYSAGNFCATCGRSLNGDMPVRTPLQPVYISVQPQVVYGADLPHCPRCHSPQIIRTKRGFSWGLGILGFFLIPGFGILLGFCGSKKPRFKCTSCSRKWKHP